MSRENKYRVWEVEAKYMSTVSSLNWTMAGIQWYGPGVGSGWCGLDPSFNWDSERAGDKPKHVDILMQYTGLHDKNEVEIYEGSLVKCPYMFDGVREIAFNKLGTVCTVNEGGQTSIDTFMLDEIEVVGSVHQNPELLK
jgi:hypothetical protein